MTKIAEGRMIIKRINLKALKIPPMKGEAIVRQSEQCEQPLNAECEQPQTRVCEK